MRFRTTCEKWPYEKFYAKQHHSFDIFSKNDSNDSLTSYSQKKKMWDTQPSVKNLAQVVGGVDF